MNNYYILSLNNNIYSEIKEGKRINSSFDILQEEDQSIMIPGYGNGLILGEEIDGKMYTLFGNMEVEYIPRDIDKVDVYNYQEVEYPGLSYYEKKELPGSLVNYILSRFSYMDVENFINTFNILNIRNKRLYGKSFDKNIPVCNINEFSNANEYILEFKKRIRKIR